MTTLRPAVLTIFNDYVTNYIYRCFSYICEVIEKQVIIIMSKQIKDEMSEQHSAKQPKLDLYNKKIEKTPFLNLLL